MQWSSCLIARRVGREGRGRRCAPACALRRRDGCARRRARCCGGPRESRFDEGASPRWRSLECRAGGKVGGLDGLWPPRQSQERLRRREF
eukprot:scaffold96200_cov34-Tisochrysis_lutea.AAC.3